MGANRLLHWPVAMICPDQQNLDDVPVGDPCPQCGGVRRNAVVELPTLMVTASAMTPTVSIGYSLEPGWAYQWNSIQRHLARLREQYKGIDTLGNVDVEQNVHSLFLSLFHLYDWLHEDSSLSLTKTEVNDWINQHQIRSAYAAPTPTRGSIRRGSARWH